MIEVVLAIAVVGLCAYALVSSAQPPQVSGGTKQVAAHDHSDVVAGSIDATPAEEPSVRAPEGRVEGVLAPDIVRASASSDLPSTVRILGAPALAPDPERFIQTEVDLVIDRVARLSALVRLVSAIAFFGALLGLGLIALGLLAR